MAQFEPALQKVIEAEGGYSLHETPGDSGGPTYAGISKEAWPTWPGWFRIQGDHIDSKLTGMVRDFYKREFWDKISGDDILDEKTAALIFSFAVNKGRVTAVKIAQRVAQVTPDGIVGPKTLSALEKNPELFRAEYKLEMVYHYKRLCINDIRRRYDLIESNQRFLIGWLNRVENA